MAVKKYRPRAADEGCVILVAPPSVTAASVDGIEYQVADDGTLELPARSAPWLLAHGFVPAPESTE